jgi:hypothetical protein
MILPLIDAIACNKPLSRDILEEYTEEKIVSDLSAHGMLSLLYPLLDNDMKHCFSSPCLEQLRTCHETCLLHKDIGVQLLTRLSPSLAYAVSMPVIIQGFALHEFLYREPLCRAMDDIDLYLPHADMRLVRDAFADAGCTHYRDYPNVLRYKNISFDLHESLWGEDRLPKRKWIAEGRERIFRKSTLVEGYYVLEPEAMATHCGFHALKHGFARKQWLLDCVLFYRHGYYERNRNDPIVETVLDYLETAAPECIDPERTRQPRKSIQRIVRKKAVEYGAKEGMGECILALLCPHLRQTALYLKDAIMPPAPILRQMYGNHSIIVLVIIRIHSLLKIAGRMLVR